MLPRTACALTRSVTRAAYAAVPAETHADTCPPLVSPVWLYCELQRGVPITVWDTSQHTGPGAAPRIPAAVPVNLSAVCTSGEQHVFHIPDAATLNTIAHRSGLQADHHLVIYDRHRYEHAAWAWWLMRACGHTRVSVLDGGLDAWTHNFATDTHPHADDGTRGAAGREAHAWAASQDHTARLELPGAIVTQAAADAFTTASARARAAGIHEPRPSDMCTQDPASVPAGSPEIIVGPPDQHLLATRDQVRDFAASEHTQGGPGSSDTRPSSARTMLLDARPAGNFCGDAPGLGGLPAGNIPGSVNIPADSLMSPDHAFRMRNASSLAAMFRTHLSGSAPAIVMGSTGPEGAILALALTSALGPAAPPVRLYVGSWADWAAHSRTDGADPHSAPHSTHNTPETHGHGAKLPLLRAFGGNLMPATLVVGAALVADHVVRAVAGPA